MSRGPPAPINKSLLERGRRGFRHHRQLPPVPSATFCSFPPGGHSPFVQGPRLVGKEARSRAELRETPAQSHSGLSHQTTKQSTSEDWRDLGGLGAGGWGTPTTSPQPQAGAEVKSPKPGTKSDRACRHTGQLLGSSRPCISKCL